MWKEGNNPSPTHIHFFWVLLHQTKIRLCIPFWFDLITFRKDSFACVRMRLTKKNNQSSTILFGPVLVNDMQTPFPLKNGQIFFSFQQMRNVLKRMQKQFFYIFSFNKILLMKFLRQRFLRTWFRNANQWYSITSWHGENVRGPGEESPNTNKLSNFFSILMHFFCIRFRWFSEKINFLKKKSVNFFSIFLESSETHFDLVAKKN